MLCSVLGATAVFGNETIPVLTLWTHGGPPGSDQFLVQINQSRVLEVSHLSHPITASGMTESKHTVALTQQQVDKLMALALDATDFSEGCNVVADGTAADLVVLTKSEPTKRSCAGASTWPVGSKTKLFLDDLNSLLPGDFRVY